MPKVGEVYTFNTSTTYYPEDAGSLAQFVLNARAAGYTTLHYMAFPPHEGAITHQFIFEGNKTPQTSPTPPQS